MKIVRFIFYKVPAIAYLIIIFILSSMSYPPVPPSVNDTILHTIEFALLFLLFYRALNNGIFAKLGKKYLYIAMILSMVYGFLDEFHQSFVPARDASLKDIIMDIVGTLTGVLIAVIISKITEWFQKPA
jgi:VanZ family protein